MTSWSVTPWRLLVARVCRKRTLTWWNQGNFLQTFSSSLQGQTRICPLFWSWQWKSVRVISWEGCLCRRRSRDARTAWAQLISFLFFDSVLAVRWFKFLVWLCKVISSSLTCVPQTSPAVSSSSSSWWLGTLDSPIPTGLQFPTWLWKGICGALLALSSSCLSQSSVKMSWSEKRNSSSFISWSSRSALTLWLVVEVSIISQGRKAGTEREGWRNNEPFSPKGEARWGERRVATCKKLNEHLLRNPNSWDDESKRLPTVLSNQPNKPL